MPMTSGNVQGSTRARARSGTLQWLASFAFTSFFFVSTPIYACFVFASFVLPLRQRYKVAQHWARANLGMLRWLCGLDYVVEGLENIPAGNHVSVWKHASAWETIAQMLIFPPQSWVLKRELMWIPIVGWATRLLHPIAIDRKARSSAVNQVLRQGKQRLEEGLWILVFPEGTRMPVGQTRRYGVSGALLAAQTGRLLVPVAHNAGYYWPRRGLMKRSGTIRVVIGPPVVAEGRDPRAVNDQLQQWVETTIARIAPAGADR
jgi:1-acyl-sn-glycerol-3-phosphate acyltransferase